MRRALCLTVVALAALALPAAAQAGRYTVRVCADPATGIGTGEAALPKGISLIQRSAAHVVKVDCGGQIQDDDGISMSISSKAPVAKSYGEPRVVAPAYTGFVSAALYRRITRTAGPNTISYRAEVFHNALIEPMIRSDRGNEQCGGGCDRLGGGVAKAPFQTGNRLGWSTQVPANALRFVLQCDQNDPCVNSSASVRIYGGSVTLQDDEAPTFSVAPTGTLTAGGTVRGTAIAEFTGADRGGGLLRAEVLIDGVVRQTTPLGTCAAPYVLLQPCPLSAKQTLSFDTTLVPDGAHNVSIRLIDATTTNQTTFGPVPVTVDNETDRGEPNGEPSVDQAELRLSLSDRPRTLRYGRSLRVHGLLRTPDGKPISGAEVRIRERLMQVNAPMEDRGSIRTGRDGRFTSILPAGPSRRVVFGYRARRNDTVDAGADALELRVPARVTLHAKRSGRTIRFTGKLLGRPRPASGKLIDLQARERGRWRTFESVRCRGGSGNFRLTYRLGPGARRVRFSFRARVRRDGSYPYVRGYSRTVRPRP